jgi:pentatricopeptide repeat protein
MPTKNVVSWTTLLSGYAEQGQGEEALKLFEQMKEEGVPPNDITFVCSLKACGSIKAIYKGRQIHCDIVTEGLERDLFISNSLIDMYAKCGLLLEAQETIDEMPSRDIISWTSLIAGYVDSGLIVEAQSRFEQMQTECVISDVISWGPLLMGYAEQGSGDVTFELYGKMLSQGLLPNRVTFMSILKACSDEGEGKKIHAQICKSGKATDRALLNNLIDMYCRVGCIDHAQEVFDEMHTRDHVTWTALMKGYLMRKESNHVLHLFGRMILEGQQPDGITFLLVLNACRYARLVQKGQKFFEMMSKEYGINPTIEHKNCMADLLRESGKIDEAVEILL